LNITDEGYYRNAFVCTKFQKKVCDLFSRKKTAEKSNMPKDCMKADNVM
jgi:hypothetical protein